MKIHMIRQHATKIQMEEMLEGLQTYIKVAVDVERSILSGGGEYQADCEEVLLEDGSRQEDIWGADWYPETGTVGFGALINIRPDRGNRSMEIESPVLRKRMEEIITSLLADTSG